MVLPPFAPPPYLDSPAYILPHPHIQPVDYRRFLHPQVPPPNAPYPNQNTLRRIRLPQAAPVRATVNSAVQTEAAQRNGGLYADGSPPIRSDSGHGTTSDSPSSTSSSQKQTSESCSLTSNHAKEPHSPKTCKKGTGEHGEDIPAPQPKAVAVPSCIGTTVERQKRRTASVDQETVPPYKNSHCNMWSVGSPDGIIPVCSSSQQEEEGVKERRISFPDILMSWGGGTPKESMTKIQDEVFDQNEKQLPSCETVEGQEKSVCHSPLATNCSGALKNSDVDDSENGQHSQDPPDEPLEFNDSGRRTFPNKDLLHSLDYSAGLEKEETIRSEEPTEIISHQMLSGRSRMTARMNESVWSVESLPPFVPPKELIIQKTSADSEIIIEMTEETENDKEAAKHDKVDDKSRKRRLEFDRMSSSDSVPGSTSWLDFSTSAQRAASLSKKPERETEPLEAKPGLGVSPAGKSPLGPVAPTAEVEQNRSSEPEAYQSPNQEMIVEPTEQEQSKCASPLSVVREVIFPNGADPEMVPCGSEECDLASEQKNGDGSSPSKGRLVDCGIQCTSLLPCPQEEPRRYTFKHSGEVSPPNAFHLQSSVMGVGMHSSVQHNN